MSSFETQWPPSEHGSFMAGLPGSSFEIRFNNTPLPELMRLFHRKYGLHVGEKPGFPDRDVFMYHAERCEEEWKELWEELHPWPGTDRDLGKITQEACDAIITLYSLLQALGVDADRALHAIMRANFTKDFNPDGGKPIKGDSFRPVDREALVHG